LHTLGEHLRTAGDIFLEVLFRTGDFVANLDRVGRLKTSSLCLPKSRSAVCSALIFLSLLVDRVTGDAANWTGESLTSVSLDPLLTLGDEVFGVVEVTGFP
jgi:hypothetical protein